MHVMLQTESVTTHTGNNWIAVDGKSEVTTTAEQVGIFVLNVFRIFVSFFVKNFFAKKQA